MLKRNNVKILYMIPDGLDRRTLRPFRWKEVSLKEFKKEWLKNGLFEYVESRYIAGDMCLYINYQKGYEKKVRNRVIGRVNLI